MSTSRAAVKTIEDDNVITLGGVRTGIEPEDAQVLLAPVVAGVFIAIFLSIWVAIPIVLFGFLGAVILISISPSYLTSQGFLKTLRYHYSADQNLSIADAAAETNDELKRGIETAESTQELTNVKRFYPTEHVVEQADNQIIGAVRVSPPNRDFATADDYQHIVNSLAQPANKNINFPFWLYVTKRPFNMDAYVDQRQDRLEDDDIQRRPILETLIEERIESRPEEIQENTYLPGYYLIVEVDPNTVNISQGADETPLQQLVDFPYIGWIFEIIYNVRSDMDDHRREAKMIEEVHTRLGTLKQEIEQAAEDIEVQRASSIETFVILSRLWRGEEPNYGNAGAALRQQPITTTPADISSENADEVTTGGDVA